VVAVAETEKELEMKLATLRTLEAQGAMVPEEVIKEVRDRFDRVRQKTSEDQKE
jgi:hypothetical protein